MELQVLDLQALGVERADDLGEIGLAGLQANRDALRGRARLAEAGHDPAARSLRPASDGTTSTVGPARTRP